MRPISEDERPEKANHHSQCHKKEHHGVSRNKPVSCSEKDVPVENADMKNCAQYDGQSHKRKRSTQNKEPIENSIFGPFPISKGRPEISGREEK